MKRTLIAVAVLLALMFVATFGSWSRRVPAQAAPKTYTAVTPGGFRVEKFQLDEETCVVIVSRAVAFSTSPCK
jgi:hypothetical protein